MSPDFDASIAFAAAADLILEGTAQPNGYTELTLHRRRQEGESSGRPVSHSRKKSQPRGRGLVVALPPLFAMAANQGYPERTRPTHICTGHFRTAGIARCGLAPTRARHA
jgi:hypothetical protein